MQSEMKKTLTILECHTRCLEEPWRQNLKRSCLLPNKPGSLWWTGLAPERCPGFTNGSLHSLTIPRINHSSRSEIRDYFDNTWTLTELLFSSLTDEEAFYRPPYHGLRHPLIFYYGHPAVLYINKLVMAGLLPQGINSHFEDIFQTGVDEMSWDDMSKNHMLWPTIDEVHLYRAQSYDAILSVINSHPDLGCADKFVGQEHPLWALFMGFEHERIHLETSSVLMRELPLRLVNTPAYWPKGATHLRSKGGSAPQPGEHFPENSLVQIPGMRVELGRTETADTFGWDNEYGSREAHVESFEASRFLISNGEYLQFVAEGGYTRSCYWTEDGWGWRNFRDVQHPTFWVPSLRPDAMEYKLRNCFEVTEMRWDLPVIVNWLEAKAFCAWKSAKDGIQYRLPTEAEHNALRHFAGLSADDLCPADQNIGLRWGGERSVDFSSAQTIHDVYGNVWQWCEDHFNPLEGSKAHRLYDDFSTPCYDGRHQMIMGGSFISTGDEATSWARFHFRPHFFQHAGIRLIHSPSGSDGQVIRGAKREAGQQ